MKHSLRIYALTGAALVLLGCANQNPQTASTAAPLEPTATGTTAGGGGGPQPGTNASHTSH